MTIVDLTENDPAFKGKQTVVRTVQVARQLERLRFCGMIVEELSGTESGPVRNYRTDSPYWPGIEALIKLSTLLPNNAAAEFATIDTEL